MCTHFFAAADWKKNYKHSISFQIREWASPKYQTFPGFFNDFDIYFEQRMGV